MNGFEVPDNSARSPIHLVGNTLNGNLLPSLGFLLHFQEINFPVGTSLNVSLA